MAKMFVALLVVCTAGLDAFSQREPPNYLIGVAVIGSQPPCVFIGGVRKKTPAADVGIRSGDRVLAVDGTAVTTVKDAAQRMHSESAKPVALQLERDGKPYTVTVERESETTMLQQAGMKVVNGWEFPLDATDAEIKKDMAFDANRITERVFPSHYAANEHLYYPGFEVFLLDNGHQVAVGGIEDGPASHAGVHWGDVIVSVNGFDPREKSVAELESLLSSPKPASMTLIVDRAGATKRFSFELAQASTVMRDNQVQIFKSHIIPIGIPQQYLSCFE